VREAAKATYEGNFAVAMQSYDEAYKIAYPESEALCC